jgi:hypothetical protein
MSKTYEEILQGLKDAFEENAAAWGDLTGYLKTTQSKNITLQDWNTLIALLGRTDAYIRAMYPLVSGLGNLGTAFKDDVSDIRSDAVFARDVAILAKNATEKIRDEVVSKTIAEISIVNGGKLCFTFKDGSTAVTESSVIGPQGEQGLPFMISKTFSSVDEMYAGAATDGVLPGQYVAIDTNVENEDSAKVFLKKEDGTYAFVVDLSGKEGIQGPQGPQGPQGEGTVVYKNGIALLKWDSDSKLDKITSPKAMSAYVINPDGTHSAVALSSTVKSGTIVTRTSGGRILTGDPTDDSNAVNLGYLKNYVSEELAKIPNAKGVSF